MQQPNKLISSLKKGLRTISPTCREASRLQSEALDHPLSPWQQFGLRVHLLLCQWCRRYGKQIRFLRQAAREHPDDLADAGPQILSSEARDRLKQSLRDESE